MKKVLHAMQIHGALHSIQLSEPVVHADNESVGRSGHIGHALTQLRDGRILAFSANTSGTRNGGHSAYGWVDYRFSDDYGNTFGEPHKLPISWKWFLEGEHTVSVEKAITLSDGTVAAFCLHNTMLRSICCEPWECPFVVLSRDDGQTWEEPVQVSPYAGRIYDVLCKDDVVYVLELCNTAEETFAIHKADECYRLFKSVDGCRTFQEVSVLPFADGRTYGNMIFTPNGDLMAFAYNINHEQHLDYAISHDHGQTWDQTGVSFLKNYIRNPQVGFLDGQYILHGRAGEAEGCTPGAFVLYTSADAIHWDEGTILIKHRHACFYSDNLTITLPNGTQRMLVKYSENYRDPSPEWSGAVNSMMLYIETIIPG